VIVHTANNLSFVCSYSFKNE